MQKSTVLEKKKDFECILTDLKRRWLQSGLADFEKHKTLAFLLMVDIFCVFQNNRFLRFFKIFLKIIKITC